MKMARIDANTRVVLKVASQIRGGEQLVSVVRHGDDLPGRKARIGAVLYLHLQAVIKDL